MSYCLNPYCQQPQNPENQIVCQTCGTKLLLKERYRAIKPIGQGGFGITFLAIDEDKPSKPYCVIKQFFPQAQGTSTVEKAAELFEKEATRLDDLGEHPQIPDLMAYFIQENRQYLVQEFISGENLARELNSKGVFSEIKIIWLLSSLLPVLQFVHKKQVIHRDIKPENIIRRAVSLGEGQLVLVDFGAAKLVNANAMGNVGTTIGSLGFVSPEQAMGRATFASDIYSLGVTCINLLTGIYPSELYDIHRGVWLWKNYLPQSINSSLGKILDKMIEDNLKQRYQFIGEVIQDLQNLSKPSGNLPPTELSVKPATPITPVTSKVELELEKIKTELTVQPTEKTPLNQSKVPHQSGANKNKIDLELEQLKSEFLKEE